MNEEAMARVGPQRHRKKINKALIIIIIISSLNYIR